MERYELAKERIAQIPDEKMAEEPYCDFFTIDEIISIRTFDNFDEIKL